jgi:hypothetical protein
VSCPSSTACEAVGSYDNSSGNLVTLAESWNGTDWTVQSTPDPTGATDNSLYGVSCLSTTACTAVGSYDDSAGTTVTLAESWNGTAWTIQSTPNPSGASSGSLLLSVSCTAAAACTAAGWYADASNSFSLAESWNGTAWTIQSTPKPTGATYSSLEIVSCISATACTAVGSYYDKSGILVTLAESWNGTAWTIQSTPDPSGAESSVLYGVSCASATACTAVGTFENDSGSSVSLAETWNGTAWKVKTTPNPAGATDDILVGVSCPSATACSAVGAYADSAGAAETLAEYWNGTSWKVKTTPNPADATDSGLETVFCSSATACTAVGSSVDSAGTEGTLAEAMSGTAWTIESTANRTGAADSGLDAVSCTSATVCTAVGSGAALTLAEVWNGTSWKVKTTPNPAGATDSVLEGVSCASTTACTAVGFSEDSSGTYSTLAEKWNGTAWTIQTTPNPVGGVLDGVSCTSTTVCTAVGTSAHDSGNAFTLAEKWNGTAWTIETTPNPKGAVAGELGGVSCTAATACTAVGSSENSSGRSSTLAEAWNGTTWTIETTPKPAGTDFSILYGVSCVSTQCTAVGLSDTPSPPSALAETWNGTTWTIETTPKPAGADLTELDAVSCTVAAACTAVGSSLDGSGTYSTMAEKWNGTAWTGQGTPNPAGATELGLGAVSCSAATACTAAGYDVTASSVELTLAEVEGG